MFTFNKKPSKIDIEYANSIETNTDWSRLAPEIRVSEEFEVPYARKFNASDYKVSECFICYFDILGYKSGVRQNRENYYLEIIKAMIDTVHMQIDDILASAYSADIWNMESKIKFAYRIFSDNVLLSFAVTDDEISNAGIIAALIEGLFRTQRNLMGQYRILIRGSMTIGELFCCNEFIYGSGLIKAVQMEERDAIYPRIIIDENVLKMIRGTKDLIYSYDSLSKYIVIDEKNDTFIGYLNAESVSIIFMTYLKRHKSLIEASIQLELPESVIEKYLWCAKYHNSICEMYELKSLLISI